MSRVSKWRHNFWTERFQRKSHYFFLPLLPAEYVTVFSGRTDAPGVRFDLTDTQTDPTTVTLAVHARRGLITQGKIAKTPLTWLTPELYVRMVPTSHYQTKQSKNSWMLVLSYFFFSYSSSFPLPLLEEVYLKNPILTSAVHAST